MMSSIPEGAPCGECKTVLGEIERNSQESSFLCMDIPVTTLNNRPRKKQIKDDRRKDRNNKLDELIKKVTALRNSKGGILLIHITGLSEGDRFLGYFDEFVDDRLNKLIEDGKQFVDTYSRFWLSDKKDFCGCKDFICLTVKASLSVSTSDFKTKIPLDCAIENPTTTNILSLLAKRKEFSDKEPVVRGSPSTLAQLNESRNTQLKAFKVKDEKEKELLHDHLQLRDYVWKDLRLREYISAFTKVDGGGSFFLGIEEKESERRSAHGDYYTKVLEVHGIRLPGEIHSAFTASIKESISKDILLCDYDGQTRNIPSNLVRIVFHDASEYIWNNTNTKSEVYVIEVSVRQITGIVFYENPGPKSFRLHNKRIVPVDGKKWFQMIKRLTDSFREKQ